MKISEILNLQEKRYTKNGKKTAVADVEDKLKNEYPDNDNAVYGTLNKIGLMRGNKTTSKGEKPAKIKEGDDPTASIPTPAPPATGDPAILRGSPATPTAAPAPTAPDKPAVPTGNGPFDQINRALMKR